ncbi:response regulator receiver protein [Methylobacterium sp. 4-46]|uniref:histidine kinase n=1 Tax=unclassified Methylobacterium TaxID=2615210 RepID=UPI000165CB24|nr:MULTISPECIES: histidine kinase [Methylobacterium]ACA19901.1 response regulator receiver protein [Methylobacterium sp. 4-46]WFT79086.1 histidine kinase [Methylobacterium nodulans]
MAGERGPRGCILIAEDEALIGIELADQLVLRGFTVAGPFPTCSQAEEWLRANEPVAAVLDNALADGPCEALARDLESRGIPFLVYSGYDHTATLPVVFQRVPWIRKPAPVEVVLAGLTALLKDE